MYRFSNCHNSNENTTQPQRNLNNECANHPTTHPPHPPHKLNGSLQEPLKSSKYNVMSNKNQGHINNINNNNNNNINHNSSFKKCQLTFIDHN